MKNIFRASLLLILLASIIMSGLGYGVSFDNGLTLEKSKVYAATVTVNVSIAESSDDLQVTSNGTSVSLTAVYATPGYVTPSYLGWAGRFVVNVPQGTVVTSANLYGTCSSAGSGTTVNYDIFGEATDNASIFSNVANYQGRRGTAAGGATDANITTNSTAVNGVAAWSNNGTYLLGDVKNIVNEILARPGFVAGNYAAFYVDDLKDRDSTSSRRFATFDSTSYLEPYLVIVYEGGAALPTVTSGSYSALSTTAVNCTGTITNTGGENPDNVCIQYGTTSGVYTANETVAWGTGVGAFNIQLTGLTAGTYYYWRAGAHNSSGWGWGSEALPFPTWGTGSFSITDVYASGGTRYKVATHVHTTAAGGDLTAAQAGNKYLGLGFAAYCISDHELNTADPLVAGILFIPGIENSYGLNDHIGAINASINATGNRQSKLNEYIGVGAATKINHPNYPAYPFTEAEIDVTTNLTGIEVYNGGYVDGDSDGVVDSPDQIAEDKWDYALTNPSNRNVWGFAGDDAHEEIQYGRAWIEVFAPSANLTNIMASIFAGNFIATSGANMTLSLVGSVLTVTSNVSGTISFKGMDGTLLQETNAVTSANYTFRGGELYVRAVIENTEGKAYSQPYWITLGGGGGITAPTVTTDAATLVEETTATLNLTITDAGGDNVTCGFEIDTDLAAPYSTNLTIAGVHTAGAELYNATVLTKGDKYAVRAWVNNSAGTAYGAVVYLMTKPDPATGFVVWQIANTSISMNWTNGAGMDIATIRYAAGAVAPATITDGSLGYAGILTTANVTSLSVATQYSFKIFTTASEDGTVSTADGSVTFTSTTTGTAPASPIVDSFVALRIIFTIVPSVLLISWFFGGSWVVARLVTKHTLLITMVFILLSAIILIFAMPPILEGLYAMLIQTG